MSRRYRGPSSQPLTTGWIDGHVACVREWVANIFFYRKDGTTIMMDAGYNYDRLAEKMAWLGIAPYDAYDESDDTRERAQSGFLKGVGQ